MVRRCCIQPGLGRFKRQGRGKLGNQLDHIGQIRAIPNNAVLQQLGFMANVIMGVGAAFNRNPRRFRDVYQNSPRLQSLIKMLHRSLAVSSVDLLGAYLKVLSPSYLLDLAEGLSPGKSRGRLLRLSKALEGVFDGNAMRSTLRHFRHDAFLTEDMLAVAGLARPELDKDLVELHAMRIALIHFIHMKVIQTPHFSTRQDVSLDELIEAILHLNIADAIGELRAIFPVSAKGKADHDYGEPSTVTGVENQGYDALHRDIFDPIEVAYALIQKISSVIATKIGAVG